MTRWWADAAQSRAVLALVDDSDLEQGVGTAVLGYHGLASSALEKLSKHTLVDVARMHRVLDSVDLEPVAKALGEATRPVLGAASGRYGELLAANLHQQAVDATERLLLSLTGTGMPWPVAIERVASVHGVPADRLGKAYGDLGKPALSPVVRADIGDRVLMEFASHVARRENTLAPVAKAMSAEEFDPEEHPRAANGRFAHAPERGQPTSGFEAREARRKRKTRANLRRTAAAPKKDTGSLGDFVSALRHQFGADPAVEQAVREDRGNARRTQLLADRKEARLADRKATRRALAGDDKPDAGLGTPVDRTGYEVKFTDHRVALIRRDQAEQLLKTETFYMGNVTDMGRGQVVWLTPDAMEEELRSINTDRGRQGMLSEYVLLSVDGDFVSTEGGPRDHDLTMSGSARLSTKDSPTVSSDGYDWNQDQFLYSAPSANPAFRRNVLVPMPVLHLELDNAGQFPRNHDDRPRASRPSAADGLPHDRGVGKAHEFDENEVRRDARGRFDDQPDRMSPQTGFEARETRRKRKAAKNRFRTRQADKKSPPARLSGQDYAVIRTMIEADEQAEDSVLGARSSDRRAGRLAQHRAQRIDQRKAEMRVVRQAAKRGGIPVVADEADSGKATEYAGVLSSRVGFNVFADPDDPYAEARMLVLQVSGLEHGTVQQAILRIGSKARGEGKAVSRENRAVAAFTPQAARSSTVEAAFDEAQSFLSALMTHASELSEKEKWQDGSFSFQGKVWTPQMLESATAYAQRRVDPETSETYFVPTVIAPEGGLSSRSLVIGSKESWAPGNREVDAEPTLHSWRELAASRGIPAEILMTTPDFAVNEYRLGFGDTDD